MLLFNDYLLPLMCVMHACYWRDLFSFSISGSTAVRITAFVFYLIYSKDVEIILISPADLCVSRLRNIISKESPNGNFKEFRHKNSDNFGDSIQAIVEVVNVCLHKCWYANFDIISKLFRIYFRCLFVSFNRRQLDMRVDNLRW